MSRKRGEARRFVSRAGDKLDAALSAFALDVTGLRCADFGCNVGGFTDCLLQRGAASVIALDTGYGTLAWSLRSDPRVETRERTNALHAPPPSGGVDLVTIDLAWTPQRLSIPSALRWLAPHGRIVTLIKPHYEVDRDGVEATWLDRGALPHDRAPIIVARVLDAMPALGAEVVQSVQSPLIGGKSERAGGATGNLEFVALLRAPRSTPE